MDARRLDGFAQGHRRQDGGESPRQHRLASPRGAEQEDVGNRTPAYHFASPVPLGMPMDPLLNLLVKLGHQCGAISRPFVEQRLGLLQVGGVKALGEPAVDRG